MSSDSAPSVQPADKPAPRYRTQPITSDEGYEIRKEAGWSDYAENHHGTVYWNELTGEIMWIDGARSNVSRLIKP